MEENFRGLAWTRKIHEIFNLENFRLYGSLKPGSPSCGSRLAETCTRYISWPFTYIPYNGNISREKNFAKASTCVLRENFARFFFRQCGKGRHIHCVIINTREKHSWIKFLPMEASGEIGKKFLLAKNTRYMVLSISPALPVS